MNVGVVVMQWLFLTSVLKAVTGSDVEICMKLKARRPLYYIYWFLGQTPLILVCLVFVYCPLCCTVISVLGSVIGTGISLSV